MCPLAELLSQTERVKRTSAPSPSPPSESAAFSRHLVDVVAFARESLAFVPDPDQTRALDPAIRRGLLNCCRQWGKSQYCSFNNPDPFGDIDSAGGLTFAGTQGVVAHLALDAAGIDPIPARDYALVEDFVQDRLMEGQPGFLVPRGE